MRYSILLVALGIVILIIPFTISEPSFNGPTPGCGGSGCHTLDDGIVSATANNLDVEVTLSGTSSDVGGELVDDTGTVVDVINSTSSNPFTLTAPGPGTYTVNAGFKNPGTDWDSTTVNINITSVEDPLNPTVYKLFDNYPNPFNPSTKIKYSVPESDFISLKVYDELGNEVATLVNEVKSAGTYEVEFSTISGSASSGNASNLSSGIYFFKLESGSFTQTKKMILMK